MTNATCERIVGIDGVLGTVNRRRYRVLLR